MSAKSERRAERRAQQVLRRQLKRRQENKVRRKKAQAEKKQLMAQFATEEEQRQYREQQRALKLARDQQLAHNMRHGQLHIYVALDFMNHMSQAELRSLAKQIQWFWNDIVRNPHYSVQLDLGPLDVDEAESQFAAAHPPSTTPRDHSEDDDGSSSNSDSSDSHASSDASPHSAAPATAALATPALTGNFINDHCRVFGYNNWKINMLKQPFHELFPAERVIVLSPDAPSVLTEADLRNPQSIFVIGGLVDKTVKKNVTRDYANQLRVTAKRLPIKEQNRAMNPILNINTVASIICQVVFNNLTLADAILKVIPQRKQDTNARPAKAIRRQQLNPLMDD